MEGSGEKDVWGGKGKIEISGPQAVDKAKIKAL
jgi:hypothetical protein